MHRRHNFRNPPYVMSLSLPQNFTPKESGLTTRNGTENVEGNLSLWGGKREKMVENYSLLKRGSNTTSVRSRTTRLRDESASPTVSPGPQGTVTVLLHPRHRRGDPLVFRSVSEKHQLFSPASLRPPYQSTRNVGQPSPPVLSTL